MARCRTARKFLYLQLCCPVREQGREQLHAVQANMKVDLLKEREEQRYIFWCLYENFCEEDPDITVGRWRIVCLQVQAGERHASPHTWGPCPIAEGGQAPLVVAAIAPHRRLGAHHPQEALQGRVRDIYVFPVRLQHLDEERHAAVGHLHLVVLRHRPDAADGRPAVLEERRIFQATAQPLDLWARHPRLALAGGRGSRCSCHGAGEQHATAGGSYSVSGGGTLFLLAEQAREHGCVKAAEDRLSTCFRCSLAWHLGNGGHWSYCDTQPPEPDR